MPVSNLDAHWSASFSKPTSKLAIRVNQQPNAILFPSEYILRPLICFYVNVDNVMPFIFPLNTYSVILNMHYV